MNHLCSIVNRIINTMDVNMLTETQEQLINEFHLSYCNDDDNSDVENVLVCDEDMTSPGKSYAPARVPIPESPTPLSCMSVDNGGGGFTFVSFLRFFSKALSSLSFEIDPLYPCIQCTIL